MARLAVERPDGLVLDVTVDDGSGPVVVLGHGAGSTPEFVRACLAGPLRSRGLRVATWDMRGHGPLALRDPDRLDISHFAADLGAVADVTGARLAGGISLGAHSALSWALGQPAGRLDALLLVCPAWTGPPDAVAAANAAQAAQLESLGLARSLELVDATAPAWMAREVRTWWARHDTDALCCLLRTLSQQPAPTLLDLSHLSAPVAVAVLADDGLHPGAVGRSWAASAARGACAETTLAAIGHDRSALGRALVRAWDQVG